MVTILPALFGHQDESFSYKEVQLKHLPACLWKPVALPFKMLMKPWYNSRDNVVSMLWSKLAMDFKRLLLL